MGVSIYSLLRFFQPFLGFVVHCVHPVDVNSVGWVEGFRWSRTHSYWVEAIVSVEQRHTITRGGRVIVGELSYWQ